MSIIVIVTSKLKDQAHRARFLELSRETEAWLAAQPGFERYELYESGDAWTDTMRWRSSAEADSGNAAFALTDIARGFAEIVQAGYRGFVGAAVHL